ncbi:LysE family translocator [Ornithinimicrobium sp. W1665]|uniref:LysE family translocator n=2 Tax=Ornithinimicrobium sp. W1665 TaxID=3416666 RepID=UPI003CF07A56
MTVVHHSTGLDLIKMLGAAYLIYLGVLAIRHRRAGTGTDGGDSHRALTSWTLLRQGFIVGVTNPKTIVFFVAALPQFVNFHAGVIPVQMMVLGFVFVLIAFVCDAVWAVLASSAASWFARSPRRLAAVRATGGGMMIGLGGNFALTGNKG